MSPERRRVSLPVDVWAEGINRRSRRTVLAGGEPLLYRGLPRLVRLINTNIPLIIYTNMQHDITEFLEIGRSIAFLVSLHPSTHDLEEWYSKVLLLKGAGHGVRFNVVRYGDWPSLKSFLEEKGETAITSAFDQRQGIKSSGKETNKKHPLVRCSSRIFLFGPGGYRYNCIRLMGVGGTFGRFEHISDADGPVGLEAVGCTRFGLCTGCDNNIIGEVQELDSAEGEGSGETISDDSKLQRIVWR